MLSSGFAKLLHAIFMSAYITFTFLSSNAQTIAIECRQGTCSYTFVVDEFLQLFLHLSFLLIKDSRPEKIMEAALLDCLC